MKYAFDPMCWEGVVTKPPYHPCVFIDAEGCRIDKPILYADTKTGIVISLVMAGNLTKQWKNGNEEGVVMDVTLHPAPLSCVPR